MTFKELKFLINEDLMVHAANTFLKKLIVVYFNMPFRLLLNYRLGHFLLQRRNLFANTWRLYLKKKQIVNRNCDISYNAKIGRRVKFPHPLSIVIGENSVVGDDVIIWQEVTLGSHGKKGSNLEYPIIGNKVKLYSGCKIIGKVNIGNSAIIGANAVVLIDVPDNQIAVGVPAKLNNNLKTNS